MINEDSDQTAGMRRLIWVFAGRTSLIADFVVRWPLITDVRTQWYLFRIVKLKRIVELAYLSTQNAELSTFCVNANKM